MEARTTADYSSTVFDPFAASQHPFPCLTRHHLSLSHAPNSTAHPALREIGDAALRQPWDQWVSNFRE